MDETLPPTDDSQSKTFLVKCDRCGEPKLPHTACSTCGTYHKRQVLDV